MRFQINSFLKNNKVMLAPMAGTTDFAYRELVSDIGCGMVFTEMVSAKALVYGDRKTKTLLKFSEKQRPVAVQLFGSDPDFMAQAARIIEQETGPDMIDVNMGCPVPKIVKNGEGSALMLKPQLAAEIVQAMVAAVNLPVSVKMRSGFNQPEINAPQLAQQVAAAGAELVTVHGRTREQYYTGKADWHTIALVKEAVSIPVVGNGDIFSPEDAGDMLQQTHCDALMIGRGAQGNPWLCSQTEKYLKGQVYQVPTLKEKFTTMRQHLQLAIATKGERTGIREMRRHLSWYVKGLPLAASFRQELFKKVCYDEVCSLLDEYLEALLTRTRISQR